MAIRAPLEIPAEDGPDRDRALVRAHVEGDPGAFQQLVLGHYQSMLGHAYRRLQDGQAAEDAVQDALVRAYRSLSPAHEDYRLGPWLHRILDNVCTDEATRRHREYEAARRFQADLVVLRPVEDESPDLEYVTAAIAALPPGYRDALMLRDVMELEYADVAEHAGITEQNARARVSRARAALRKLVASTVTVWLVLGRLARRGTIGAPKLIREVSTSAATLPPETVANSTRGISAASTIALTAVAVASVAAPAFIPGAPSTPTAPTPGQNSVKAGPQSGGLSQIVTLPRVGTQAYTVAPAPPSTDVPTTDAPKTFETLAPAPKIGALAAAPTTTTTLAKHDPNQPAYPAWTGSTVPAPAGSPIPDADFSAPTLNDVPSSQSDSLAGSGALGWASAGATGPFTGSLGTPESRCGSAINGTLDMESQGAKPATMQFWGELTSTWSDSRSRSWGFVGQVVASGSPDYEGAGWIQGIVSLASDGTVEVTGHLWGKGQADAPKGPGSCNGASGTSQPSTASPTSSSTSSTTAPPAKSSPGLPAGFVPAAA